MLRAVDRGDDLREQLDALYRAAGLIAALSGVDLSPFATQAVGEATTFWKRSLNPAGGDTGTPRADGGFTRSAMKEN